MALEGSERELLKFAFGQYDHRVITDTALYSGRWYRLYITADAVISSLVDAGAAAADYADFATAFTITDDDAPGTNSLYVVQDGTLSDGKVYGHLECETSTDDDVAITLAGGTTLTITDNDAAAGDDVWLDYNAVATEDRLVSEITGDVDVYLTTNNPSVWVKVKNVADEDADNSSAVMEKSEGLVSTVQDNADKDVNPVTTDPYNGLSVSAGAVLYGRFSRVQLTSGAAIIYSGPGRD